MKTTLSILLISFLIAGCNVLKISKEYPEAFEVHIENPASINRIDEMVQICIKKVKTIHPDFNPDAFVVISNGVELASQACDMDGDSKADVIMLVSNFSELEKKTLTIRYKKEGQKVRLYRKRTQAELSHKFGGQFVNHVYEGGTFKNVNLLRVPQEHTDHSFFIRYEGPGWESDRVGYRFYLDWRNAIDIYGKKVQDMVLQNVGLDGFESYHEMADWGMDILKVGESLGIGSIGMWWDGKCERVAKTDSILCKIVSNGPIQSQIQTQYHGWKVGSEKYDLVSNLSIMAGSRLTKHSVKIQPNPSNICTGIVKHEGGTLSTLVNTEGNWLYMATYGIQSLAEDRLGMAVLFRKENVIKVTEDEYSHVVILKPVDGQLTYYFLAAWEKEANGIQSEETFFSYLDETISRLNTPLVTELK